MADVVIGGWDSPASRDAAIARGETPYFEYVPPGGGQEVRPIPVIPPAQPVIGTGTVDPEQMFADGFVYINGVWVRSLGDAADYARAVSGTRPPGSASVLPPPGGMGLPGYNIPTAPPVLLPSFVGGRLGVVRQSGGLRPESGGTPRVVKTVGTPYPWTRVVKSAGSS